MFWNEKAECMDKDEKEKIQLKRLQETVKIAYENVEFYKKRLDEAGIKPEDVVRNFEQEQEVQPP